MEFAKESNYFAVAGDQEEDQHQDTGDANNKAERSEDRRTLLVQRMQLNCH